jgi:maleylpyruvate isomerase
MPRPSARIELARQGDAFFLTQLERIDDAGFEQPSALPGWTRSHVIGHMARNADALGNLLSWARTGVETPMYASVADRASGIETTSKHSPDELRADVRSASSRLMESFAEMPEQAWDEAVRTARGRAIPASEVPWMRIRESWVHAIDLDAGASLDEIPEQVVIDLLDEVASGLAGRSDAPAMIIDAGSRAWRVGSDGVTSTVVGSATELLGWIIGRAPGPAGAPAPPAWL